jgi:hypothetical protein
VSGVLPLRALNAADGVHLACGAQDNHAGPETQVAFHPANGEIVPRYPRLHRTITEPNIDDNAGAGTTDLALPAIIIVEFYVYLNRKD